MPQGAHKFDFIKVLEPQSAESFSAYTVVQRNTLLQPRSTYSEYYALQLMLLYYAITATI